ncbi:hypothetical protein EDB81DRAFT_246016 [Dactylonectria macrodidyma]|uniref:Uncharacterized protein n=1 Tax=Dactylonectria macrodidyma TaxID=307937 RepID=A0A9P9DEJ1_9HYPO|nr:hypothetical protein EDB81DRAFT_246016 [Dactylonectria macrodidyma]
MSGSFYRRRPQETQKNTGGDMSMVVFVQPDCPSRFAYIDKHHIKGLNAETIARVYLPQPSWILATEYITLQTNADNSSTCIFFSLNLSIYNQQIDPSDWTEGWFLMHGRVHPYALTWEIDQVDDSESENRGFVEYTIPALIVRDQSYQPITPRNFSTMNCFPTTSPIVSFTGPIVGCGRSLLQQESIHTLGEVQLKCCGFVQLSTFIAPGSPDRTPYKGFHPFQVFVIFPIHANPWASLCKKMTDRQDTQFQPKAMFTCTGKVAGLLNHHQMIHPPDLERDYVFIVVPDTWTFLDRAMAASTSATPSPTTTSKQRSSASLPFNEAKALFTTPPKRKEEQPDPLRSVPAYAANLPATPPTSHGNHDIDHTPTKKPRLTTQDRLSNTQPSESSDSLQSPTTSSDTRTLDSIAALPPDPSTRPHRGRHPSKKSQGLD